MNALLLLAALLLPSLSWAQTFPSVGQLDTFTRPNEGPPPSSSWTTARNTGHKVVSNQMAMDDETLGQASTWTTFTGADVEMAAKIGTVQPSGKYINLYARLQTANDYNSDMYQVDVVAVAGASNDSLEFWKRVSTVFTQLGATVSLGADLAANDVWGGRIIGTTIEGFYNGTSQGSRTDSDISLAGSIGISHDANSTNVRMTGFWGGTTYTHASESGCDRILLQSVDSFLLAENADFLTLESGTCGASVTVVPARMLMGVGL